MIADELVASMKERYAHVHPLVFQRSLEHAQSHGELFDILESIPELPYTWDEVSHRWIHMPDLTYSRKLRKK